MATAKKKTSSPAKKTTSKKVTKTSSKKPAASKSNKKSTSVKKSSSKAQAKTQKDSNMWKILSFVFVLVIVVLLAGIISLLTGDESMKDDKMMDDSQNEVATGEDPEVTLTIIEDPSCTNCQVDVFAQQIKENLISNLEYNKINVDSTEGEQFKAALNLELVPAYLFSSEIAQRSDWATNLAGAFQEQVIGGETFYMLDPQYVQGKYLIDEIEITDSTIVIGDENAPITVIEFSDYECPFCGIAEGNPELVAQFQAQSPGYEAPIPKLFEEYVNTGKVKFVFMNFPLESIHNKARSAHNAALCAYEQGEWKEFNDMLFVQRNDWIEASDSVAVYNEFAAEIGLDETQFSECLSSNKYNSQIDEELKVGFSKGVSGTPAFFVGKHFLSGAQDFTTFKTLIDAELAK